MDAGSNLPELYRARVGSAQRTALLLGFLALLVLLLSIDHTFDTGRAAERLSIVLYDYSRSYQTVLLEWQLSQNIIGGKIPFERLYDRDEKPDNGYLNTQTIPFFDEYLDQRLPEGDPHKYKIFAITVNFETLFIVIVFGPTILLIIIRRHIGAVKLLREKYPLAHQINDMLMTTLGSLPFARRSAETTKRTKFVLFCSYLFAASFVSSALFLSAAQIHPQVKGVLRVDPLAIPELVGQ
jgi:hypothetical protein